MEHDRPPRRRWVIFSGLLTFGGLSVCSIGLWILSNLDPSFGFTLLGIISILLVVLGSFILLIGGTMLGAFFFDRNRSHARLKGRDWLTESMWSDLAALCEHLERIGLDVAMESKEAGSADLFGGTIGSVRVTNRNIDLIELNRAGLLEGAEGDGTRSNFWCAYVVQARVKDLEDGQMAKGKPVTARRGLFHREIVGFEWKGKKLAQILNSDSNLNSYFISQRHPPKVVVYKGHPSGIRIFEEGGEWGEHGSPQNAFPTLETFEAYDRIAHHIRSIASGRHDVGASA